MMLSVATGASADPSEWAQEIHAKGMEASPDYRAQNRSKVMTVCVTWPETATGEPRIHGFGMAMAGDSGKDQPPSELRGPAMNRCVQSASKKDPDCKCEFLDVNGKNVLQAPSY
ncbi:MAG: hypothetical protein AAGD47_05825 [Pseudomonadota bacterium]